MSEDPTTTYEEPSGEDMITVTYSREEYRIKWQGFWRSIEFRLWILASVGMIGLTMLGLLFWSTGLAVLPVVVHVEFQFPLTLVLSLCGVIVYGGFLLLLIARLNKYALDFRRRLEHPVYPPVRVPASVYVPRPQKDRDSMPSEFPRGKRAVGRPENPDVESACEGLEKRLEARDRRLQGLLERNTSLEKKMVFWNVRRLAREFHMSTHAVSRLLRSLGAERWSRQSTNGPTWFWEG